MGQSPCPRFPQMKPVSRKTSECAKIYYTFRLGKVGMLVRLDASSTQTETFQMSLVSCQLFRHLRLSDTSCSKCPKSEQKYPRRNMRYNFQSPRQARLTLSATMHICWAYKACSAVAIAMPRNAQKGAGNLWWMAGRANKKQRRRMSGSFGWPWPYWHRLQDRECLKVQL